MSVVLPPARGTLQQRRPRGPAAPAVDNRVPYRRQGLAREGAHRRATAPSTGLLDLRRRLPLPVVAVKCFWAVRQGRGLPERAEHLRPQDPNRLISAQRAVPWRACVTDLRTGLFNGEVCSGNPPTRASNEAPDRLSDPRPTKPTWLVPGCSSVDSRARKTSSGASLNSPQQSQRSTERLGLRAPEQGKRRNAPRGHHDSTV